MLSRYSYSSLDSFRTCPRQFKFRYVEKVDVPRKVTADTFLGNVIHRTLARLYELGSDGVLLPQPEMLSFYRAQWESARQQHISLTDEYHTVDDFIRLGERLLSKHYERYQPFTQGTLLGTELRLTFTLDGTQYRFLAIVDRLWKREDGVVEICDYKTGRNLARPTDEDFRYQMGLYQLAVAQNYPQWKTIELAQYYLRMDEIVRHQLRPDELDELQENLRGAVLETIEAQRLDSFPTIEGRHCSYCDFFTLCPAKRHKLMIDAQRAGSAEATGSPAERAYALATRFLEIDQNSKLADAERTALRTEIIALAKEMNVTRLEGAGGRVQVTVSRKEEFVTKSDDARAFAELSKLAREFGLNEYFVLDGRGLMKEIIQKQRLNKEQLERLRKFAATKEHAVVTAKAKIEPDPEST
ncbi:MAG TPA: PD-(D/E)XK nuclease family protein [Candidatus Deferrimicrobium sp.]|nr:PD-(D/E)XK nuclease family protein [Candidatus Deferrimicrobium sp.]